MVPEEGLEPSCLRPRPLKTLRIPFRHSGILKVFISVDQQPSALYLISNKVSQICLGAEYGCRTHPLQGLSLLPLPTWGNSAYISDVKERFELSRTYVNRS